MEQVFDKLGIYDLVAVLLSGICITAFSFLTAFLVWMDTSIWNFFADNTLFVLVLSYFAGLLFQEMSSFLFKNIIFPDNKLLKFAWNKEVGHFKL